MLRSGSICISFLYKYLMSDNEINNEDDIDGNKNLIQKSSKLKCLADTFQSYGGVLAKLSQIVCYENQDSTVFSDCKPFSRDETIQYFKEHYNEFPEFFKNVKYIDFEPYKSGSIGQVHKGVYKDGTDIIIKVQYVGLKEQIDSDLFILDKLISYLYSFANLSNAMIDIKTKLNEELDYTLESFNQQHLHDVWSDNDNIKIPQIISELSNDNLITMEFIEGENLNIFIANSTQEERNNIGKYMVEFIFTNLYKEGIFYSDIHYGNFIIKDKTILYVMDFGCINDINDKLLKNLRDLHVSMINDDKELFYSLVENMGIIKDTISDDSKDYIYNYFKIQYEPWISEEFEFTKEWLDKSIYKNTYLMSEWELPNNMIYLNKIPFGMYHLLTKLELKGSFLDFFKKLLDI